MVTLRLLALLPALGLSACGGMPALRPLSLDGGSKPLSRFEQIYDAGKANLGHDRVGLALVLFEKALAIEPNSVAALNAAGAACDALHHPDLAARYYERALALAPTDLDTLHNMAVSAMMAGRADAARALLERAPALGSAYPLVRARLAAIGVRAAPAPGEATLTAPDTIRVERIGPAEFRLSVAMRPNGQSPSGS